MMHEPMLMLALAVLVALAALLMLNGARKRRLTVKIEPVPAARLDNTPVRSEILGEVRVRERDDALPAGTADAPSATAEATPEVSLSQLSDDVHVDAMHVETIAAEPDAAPVIKLSQADLFPEDIHRPKVPSRVESADTSAPALAI